MDREQNEQTIRLLEATHKFPCPFLIKVIGRTENGFVSRVVAALREAQQLASVSRKNSLDVTVVQTHRSAGLFQCQQ